MGGRKNLKIWILISVLAMLGLCVDTVLALDGSGTQEDPWRIESLADFDEFADDPNYWAGYTRLETVVNLAGRTYTTAVIALDESRSRGFQGTAFTGVFEGDGHKITGLTIDDGGAGNEHLGLFGFIANGEVRNLGIEGGSVSGSGDRYVGGLVGVNDGSVSNCYFTGSVRGTKGAVGGLAGQNYQVGSISNCYSTGDVTGNIDRTWRTVGGLVGDNYGIVSNCYSTGSVNGYKYIGGLVGRNYQGSISNCYSTGSVSGDADVGGLVGFNNRGSISNCYSTGSVNGYKYIGGLVGENWGSVSNCFWDINTSGMTTSHGGTGLPTAEMQAESTFTSAGWDFTTPVWKMCHGPYYPILWWQKCPPAIIYVDADATGANNGWSWVDAYKFLQDALADANFSDKPVEIRVAQGIYKPDQGGGNTPGDRTATFRLINGVTIKGGYAGFGELDPDAKDIDLYKTILSGDLSVDDKPNFVNNGENSYSVVTGSGTNETAILDGFITIGGNANGVGDYSEIAGAGMFCLGGSPILTNCTFSRNSAVNGGGMYNEEGKPALVNCTFNNNSAAEIGGGIFSVLGNLTLIDCTFSTNLALVGGAILDSGNSMLTNCTFTGNSALGGGSAGGAIYNIYCSPTVNNCIFISNSAHLSHRELSAYQGGGGMYNDDSSPRLTNCIFRGNYAQYHGGAINSVWGDTGPIVINCTFNGNIAGTGGGAICNLECSKSNILNCILWKNWPNQIRSLRPSSVTINYSDVQGGWTGVGNIDVDPCFVEPGYWADANDPNIVVEPNDTNAIWIDGDYHLLPDSMCINAGDPNYVHEPNETDIDGESRVMLDRVDMGADEFNPFEVSFAVVNKRRIGRTVFEYECKVTLENVSGFTVRNVQLEMVKASDNMTIIEPAVSFVGDIGPGGSADSVDTCTFQVDRTEAIDPAKIIWTSTCEMVDTGETVEQGGSSFVFLGLGYMAGDFTGDGEVDFEDFARLGRQWLWVGPEGGIPEDIVEDGTVNLADFAKLAGGWMKW